MSTTDVYKRQVLFLKTGVCGGFTTFSAFSLETLALLERGKYATGALYACFLLYTSIVDTCLASVAEALLVYEALRQRDNGMTAQELARWAEEARYFVDAEFMVDDLEAVSYTHLCMLLGHPAVSYRRTAPRRAGDFVMK